MKNTTFLMIKIKYVTIDLSGQTAISYDTCDKLWHNYSVQNWTAKMILTISF